MQWSVETYPLPLNDARIGIWSAQDHSKIQPRDYRSRALPFELSAVELVPGAGFEPAAIPLCKRGGFDHSHHPGINLARGTGIKPAASSFGRSRSIRVSYPRNFWSRPRDFNPHLLR